uniref:Putative secreted protein n=1 Tax=Ixodes ricinus TaxID=34613 RepID=A0A6B0UC19_IXORI
MFRALTKATLVSCCFCLFFSFIVFLLLSFLFRPGFACLFFGSLFVSLQLLFPQFSNFYLEVLDVPQTIANSATKRVILCRLHFLLFAFFP